MYIDVNKKINITVFVRYA